MPCAQREVEVGYGLAESRRGLGYASAALAELLTMATTSDEVDRVVGFTAGDERLDEDGELTVRWTLRVPPGSDDCATILTD